VITHCDVVVFTKVLLVNSIATAVLVHEQASASFSCDCHAMHEGSRSVLCGGGVPQLRCEILLGRPRVQRPKVFDEIERGGYSD
jgi:hypothetical protein